MLLKRQYYLLLFSFIASSAFAELQEAELCRPIASYEPDCIVSSLSANLPFNHTLIQTLLPEGYVASCIEPSSLTYEFSGEEKAGGLLDTVFKCNIGHGMQGIFYGQSRVFRTPASIELSDIVCYRPGLFKFIPANFAMISWAYFGDPFGISKFLGFNNRLVAYFYPDLGDRNKVEKSTLRSIVLYAKEQSENHSVYTPYRLVDASLREFSDDFLNKAIQFFDKKYQQEIDNEKAFIDFLITGAYYCLSLPAELYGACLLRVDDWVINKFDYFIDPEDREEAKAIPLSERLAFASASINVQNAFYRESAEKKQILIQTDFECSLEESAFDAKSRTFVGCQCSEESSWKVIPKLFFRLSYDEAAQEVCITRWLSRINGNWILPNSEGELDIEVDDSGAIHLF